MKRVNQDYRLTVQEVLERPVFRPAYLAAGKAGLRRLVRWVHIIEVIRFDQLLQGGELILTTGAAFKSDTAAFMTYLEQLVRCEAACLCIEMGHHVSAVPQAWLDAADAVQLPVIVFPRSVRFIDITQDIHAHMINQHHRALQELERISRAFHRMTLSSQGIGNVLELLRSSTNAEVVYVPQDGQPKFIPPVSAREAGEWLGVLADGLRRENGGEAEGGAIEAEGSVNEAEGNAIKAKGNAIKAEGSGGGGPGIGGGRYGAGGKPAAPLLVERNGQTVIVQPVGAMGKTWAHLMLVLSRKPQEYEYLILDSASLSIAQDLLRKRYVEERRLYTQTMWVDDLLHLRIPDEEQVKLLIGPSYKQLNETEYHVIIAAFDSGAEARAGLSGSGGEDWGIGSGGEGRGISSGGSGGEGRGIGNGGSFGEGGRSGSGDGEESAGIHLSLAVRAVFEQHAFQPFITFKNDRLVLVAFDRTPKKPAKARLQRVFQALEQLKAEENVKVTVGVGRRGRGFMQAHASYQEALQAISLAPALQANQVFYDEIGVFGLLFHIADKQVLTSFVRTYLGPVIDHDAARGSDLLRTLNVYLDCDGSKGAAARQLFIVRQSLYYRLEKIEELLGADFMQPEKRLALQVGLRAYRLLHPDAHL